MSDAATVPSPEVIQLQVNLTAGAIIVGAIVSYLCLGVVLSGSWTYFSRYKNDPLHFRLLVGGNTILAIVDGIATGKWAHKWGTTYWSDMTTLDVTPWECLLHFILIATVTIIVQWFYAWRIWMISQKKNLWMPALIVALSIMWFGVYCWMVQTVRVQVLFSKMDGIKPNVYIWLVGSVLVDLTITAGMGYYLDLRYRMKRAASQVSSKARFRAILRRTVECNVLSLIAQVTVVVTFYKAEEVGMYFTLAGMTLVSIYTFSLIVSLNGRPVTNQMGGGAIDSSTGPSSNVLGERRATNQVAISIQHNTVQDHSPMYDDDYAISNLKAKSDVSV